MFNQVATVDGNWFGGLRLHGNRGSLLHGYQDAAVLGQWTIDRPDGIWLLTATIVRLDHAYKNKRPLMFTAPREHGWWSWGIESVDYGEQRLLARLGPPEQ